MSTEITTDNETPPQPKRKAKAEKKTKGAKATKRPGKATSAKAPRPPSRRMPEEGAHPRTLAPERGSHDRRIAQVTEWQNHSIRGFLSGTITKKMRLALESSKDEGGERTYRITD